MPGASCRPEPSPAARALRLAGLRATGPDALATLVESLPPPPWDAAVPSGEPLAGWLGRLGFEPYAEVLTVARPLAGLPRALPVAGTTVEPYRNEWAEPFTAAEAAAMGDLAVYREMGTPTGFEEAAGQGAFPVVVRGDRIVGFAQAALPDGWINWIGVVPEERRQGVGRLLVGEVARAVAAARGTHLAAETEVGGGAHGFWRALGFRDRGRRVLLIRRA